MKKAVILFSGGLDSTTCLALAKAEGFACHALSFNYAQRHQVELTAAKKIAVAFQVSHQIIDLPMTAFSGCALTDSTIAVPEYEGDGKIPVTYVPARNTIFLAIALGIAEVLDAQDIFIGSSFVDYSGYPDCRPEYFAAFQTLANLATKTAIEGNTCNIHTPLIHLSKAQTIALGISLNVDYSMTVSCYQANQQGAACGKCDSCYLRKKGFQAAAIADPTVYA